MTTPHMALPSQAALQAAYVGLPLAALPAPSVVIDVGIMRRNAERMRRAVEQAGVRFRCHIKTHKTVEGTRICLGAEGGVPRQHRSIIVSTLAEAWHVLPLVEEGVVADILYGVPLPLSRIAEARRLRDTMRLLAPPGSTPELRFMIDSPAQIEALDRAGLPQDGPWSAFVKVDCGYGRAGLDPATPELHELLQTLHKSTTVALYGFYAHAGHSYGSRSAADASGYLAAEIAATQAGAQVWRSLLSDSKPTHAQHTPLVLSVGSTPTAHALAERGTSTAELDGELEVHAGNYGILDLQQLATGVAGDVHRVAMTLLCNVTSTYPQRHEAMIDAGGIALSKDSGPFGGHGHVLWPQALRGWQVSRVSQEHGVLGLREGDAAKWEREWQTDGEIAAAPAAPRVGDLLRIVPQHACMTAAAHPWFFVVDSTRAGAEETVCGVWVPQKGW